MEKLSSDESGISRAAALLTSGKLVSFPTETVYGLGADARNGQAVARIYEAKGRPAFNPLIVHVASAEAAGQLTQWTDAANALTEAFWPGPLTLVLPLRPDGALSELVTAGLPSVAVRVPSHPVAQAVLATAGIPVAAPSANPSGRITATTAAHVIAGLGTRIEAVLDGGPCAVGVESTIVGLVDEPRLLRPGGVPVEDIEAVLGAPLRTATNEITAPGQLASHYAPNSAVRLEAITAQQGEFHIGFGTVPGDLNLSETGDLREAAANLFAALHQADAAGKPIAVAPIPAQGLGRAINDRLGRAAAPRP